MKHKTYSSKKNKRLPNKKLSTFSRIIIGLSLLGLGKFALVTPDTLETLKNTPDPIIFSTQCQDNLRKLICDTISSAEKEVFISVYSLTDRMISESISRQAENGIPVKVSCHYAKDIQQLKEKSPKIITIPFDIPNAKMHTKIIVADKELVLIGSANYTPTSLDQDENLTVGIRSQVLGHLVSEEQSGSFSINGKQGEYFVFPKDSMQAKERIISLISTAQKTIRIGMLALSEKSLLRALKKAQNRGVEVQLMVDKSFANLTKENLEKIHGSNLPLWIKKTPYRLHHKFAWIDEKILISGSANWSNCGFNSNTENILILYDLNEKQNKKIRKIWERMFMNRVSFDEFKNSPEQKAFPYIHYKKPCKQDLVNREPSFSYFEKISPSSSEEETIAA